MLKHQELGPQDSSQYHRSSKIARKWWDSSDANGIHGQFGQFSGQVQEGPCLHMISVSPDSKARVHHVSTTCPPRVQRSKPSRCLAKKRSSVETVKPTSVIGDRFRFPGRLSRISEYPSQIIPRYSEREQQLIRTFQDNPSSYRLRPFEACSSSPHSGCWLLRYANYHNRSERFQGMMAIW